MAARRFRWPVSASRLIEAPVEDVWGAISMQGNLEMCHPFCKANPVIEWPGPESHDEVHYLNGLVFERRFTGWNEGVGYDLDIGRAGGATSHVSWRIDRAGDRSSRLAITVEPYVVQRYPLVIRWVPHLAVVRPRLRSYLESVVGGFAWYLEKGEPVPRKAFGSHPWFSD